MSRKSPEPLHIGRPQSVVAEEITDPAEIAAAEKTREERMRKRRTPPKPLHIGRPQSVVAEEITDPAEIAALDKMLEERRRKRGGAASNRGGAKSAKPSSAKKKT